MDDRFRVTNDHVVFGSRGSFSRFFVPGPHLTRHRFAIRLKELDDGQHFLRKQKRGYFQFCGSATSATSGVAMVKNAATTIATELIVMRDLKLALPSNLDLTCLGFRILNFRISRLLCFNTERYLSWWPCHLLPQKWCIPKGGRNEKHEQSDLENRYLSFAP